ncbi:MAG: hypothetical protein ACI81Y_002700 [Glaciecola sp.]|jgi:hypothetical protein
MKNISTHLTICLLTLISLITWSPTSAQSQNALHFDGINDNVQLTHFDRPETMTIEIWLKAELNPEPADIISWSNSSGGYTAEVLIVNGNVGYAEYDGTDFPISDPVFIGDGDWHHIAIVRDGGGLNNVSMYLDGVLQTITSIDLTGPTNDLRLGAENFGSVLRFYQGAMDDLKIWNYARTVEEIQSDMNIELIGDEEGLLTYYNFNQGIANEDNDTVDTLIDGSAGGNTGDLNNFSLSGTISNWIGGPSVLVTGMEENEGFNNISVYPNPTDGRVNLELKNDLTNVTVEVFNILGNRVHYKHIDGGLNHSFDLDVESGIYLVQVSNKSQSHSFKLVVR